MSEVIVGIDLGTSNCVVAHSDGAGEVRTLADEAGYKVHPSVVSFLPSGGVVVGAEAKQRKVIDPQNTIFSAKRLIGRSFRSPEVQMAKARMPYQIREGANQLPLISTRAGEFAIPEISAVLLDHVRNIAARALGQEVTQAVITVPANFNDAQRSATATAGAIAGITVVRVLNEPTAAALAYGHTRQLKQTIAVYDFGGGTFDVTLLRLDDQVYEVLGTAGDSFLGGDDLDERLVDRMVERFLAEQRIDLRNNEVAMMRLRAVAEQTKIELSRRTRAVVRIDEIAYGARGAPLNLQIEVTREEFVAMTADIIQRTFPVCQEALKIAGLSVDRIDDIVLVGGTTKVPAVREQVAKFFQRTTRADINPEEAVAIGAALQADSLQRILARPGRPSSLGLSAGGAGTASPTAVTSAAAAHGASLDEHEATSQGAPPTNQDTAVTGAPGSALPPAGRMRRPTADAGAGMRPFSERPMTRGVSVDRFESKETTGTMLGRMEGARTEAGRMDAGRTDAGRMTTSATGTTAVGLIPASPDRDTSVGFAPGGPGRAEETSTRRSYVGPSEAGLGGQGEGADEDEATASRPPIRDPEEEETSSGAPVAVRPEATRSLPNAAAAGRRPAMAPPPVPSGPGGPGGPGGASGRTTGQMGMAGASSAASRPTMMQPSAAPSSLATQPLPPPQPPAPPPPPLRQRASQPKIAAPSGVPVRESLPAIDDSQVHVLPVAPLGPGGLPLSSTLDPGASSTAPGMSFPNDPAVTARGLVPNVPASLAGQPLPQGMYGGLPPPPQPSTTARGVAPAAPTMMIGAGLASAGPAAPQRAPGGPSAPPPSGPPSGPSVQAGPPPPAGPQARTMMAQAPGMPAGMGRDELSLDDALYPSPAPPRRPSQPGMPGGFGPPPGLGPIPGGSFQPPGAAPPDPFAPFDRGSVQPPLQSDPFAAFDRGLPQPAPPPPPPSPPGPPDAFANLPTNRAGGAQLRTPMPFASPAVRRPGEEDPFFAGGPGGVAGPGALPPYAPTMAPQQVPPMVQMAALAPSPVVLDVTPRGLGLVTVAGFCEELIPRNTRVPTEMRRSFSTSRDGQDLVRLVITQGEARRVEGNVVLGELVLADLPRRPRGETTIEVIFAIDASGILHVRARDVMSGREQRASLNVIGTLPEGDVAASRERMQQFRR